MLEITFVFLTLHFVVFFIIFFALNTSNANVTLRENYVTVSNPNRFMTLAILSTSLFLLQKTNNNRIFLQAVLLLKFDNVKRSPVLLVEYFLWKSFICMYSWQSLSSILRCFQTLLITAYPLVTFNNEMIKIHSRILANEWMLIIYLKVAGTDELTGSWRRLGIPPHN